VIWRKRGGLLAGILGIMGGEGVVDLVKGLGL